MTTYITDMNITTLTLVEIEEQIKLQGCKCGKIWSCEELNIDNLPNN